MEIMEAQGKVIQMEYAELKEWLDKQVAWRNEGLSIKDFNGQISIIDFGLTDEKSIHLVNVDVVADILGVELQIEEFVEGLDRLYFMYEGYKVFYLVERKNVG